MPKLAWLGLAAVFLLAGPTQSRADDISDDWDQLASACIGVANTAWCETNRDKVMAPQFRKAFAGDYQSQRNVSYCLAEQSACDGAMTYNRPLGCAWRIVILLSGSARVDATDTGFFDAWCRRALSVDERAVSMAQAGALYQRIYRKPLPTFSY